METRLGEKNKSPPQAKPIYTKKFVPTTLNAERVALAKERIQKKKKPEKQKIQVPLTPKKLPNLLRNGPPGQNCPLFFPLT